MLERPSELLRPNGDAGMGVNIARKAPPNWSKIQTYKQRKPLPAAGALFIRVVRKWLDRQSLGEVLRVS
ncbi:hypothetical protein BK143_19765 [Paenibacillus peoriae]|nr:hypothetical protein PPYC2_24040 [Paenibacillus polymyxa]OMF69828.1 hypothetical protein BK143_19765 [Paenibacillus peoriae]OMF79053.1 hypothetical protein BK145_14365 [Paenibacillus peoriae]POR28222.1 hypothetical protein CG775_10775 [Paenibacillus polymyxa]